MLRHTCFQQALLTIYLGAAVLLRAQTANPPLQTLVTATDHASAPDLATSNLELKVDGRVVPITSVVKELDLPVRIGIVFDESGSGRHVGLYSEILQRSLDFTADILKQSGSDAFLVGFNDQVIISTEVVTDAGRLRAAAGQLRPIGGSAVRDALVHAAQKFYSLGPEPRPATRILLFVSDGPPASVPFALVGASARGSTSGNKPFFSIPGTPFQKFDKAGVSLCLLLLFAGQDLIDLREHTAGRPV